MKNRIDNLSDIYESCNCEGLIKPKARIDLELIKSLLESAKQGYDRLKTFNLSFEKKTHNYAFILRDYYEILRALVDAFLFFDKVSISNHQCSNAYLCTKHLELEFDWEILETMRLFRNAINYEGKQVDLEQWNKIKLQFKIYISTLKKNVESKLK